MSLEALAYAFAADIPRDAKAKLVFIALADGAAEPDTVEGEVDWMCVVWLRRLARSTGLLAAEVESALARLSADGWVDRAGGGRLRKGQRGFREYIIPRQRLAPVGLDAPSAWRDGAPTHERAAV